MTALHWACKKGHRNVALELINTDADLDAEDAVGRTPLYLALDGLHNDIARDLLYHLASPWSTTKISYQTLYQINPQSKKILSTRRKLDILLSMTPPKQRKQIWIEEALKLYVNV
jgi:ankyrin repeat protein